MTVWRVLLVDDDEDLRALCRICLEAEGSFEVFCAGSCEEALALADHQRLDLMLIDLCMPGRDGADTLASLRAHPATAGVPAVLMTAATGTPIGRGDWSAIVQKPFEVRGLGKLLKRIALVGAERDA